MSDEIRKEDTFNILVATDCHLGYQRYKKAGNEFEDSFITFEEILQYAEMHKVDFILLGGDLFDEAKPSHTTLVKCMELLRKYCLGSREIDIELLSDPEKVFKHCGFKTVNYEDENINVSIPVFTIHGNHDNPTDGGVGTIDLLSMAGLVNYFGKVMDLSTIKVPPVILKKGESHLALYGLSYVNDQRLSRLLKDEKVEMIGVDQLPKDCFNILVLHQNRVKHESQGYIPENKIPNIFNLVIWGHEHECRITPEFASGPECFICQPGSSVVTSLCEAEAVPKHVALLKVNKGNFKIKKLKLQTVRPFVFDNIILSDENIPKHHARTLAESVYEFVDDYIEKEVMTKAAEQLTGHPKQPIQPLVRVRVFYSSEDEIFDTMKLAIKYNDEVANPNHMILFRKYIPNARKSKPRPFEADEEVNNMMELIGENEDVQWTKTVEDEILKYCRSEKNKDKLMALSTQGLTSALREYAVKNDTDAFRNLVKREMKNAIDHLFKQNVSVDSKDDILEALKAYRVDLERTNEEEGDDNEPEVVIDKTSQKTAHSSRYEESESSDDGVVVTIADEPTVSNRKASRGRGRGRGKATKGKANKNELSITSVKGQRKPREGKNKAKEIDFSKLPSFDVDSSSS